MDRFVVEGPTKLKGTVEAGGSKNAALPILFATLLSEGPHQIQGVPRLADMESTNRMLVYFGASVEERSHQSFGSDWRVDAANITSFEAPYDYVRKMRASFFCLGPLLARMGKARVSLPGGCAIGARPIDLHLMALEKLGAEIEQSAGYVEARSKGRLVGANIVFPKVSVGATENAMMAASTAKGTTVLENSAREPEIVALAEALTTMGAQIEGAGTSTITIQGVEKLKPMNYRIPPDRIEIATYLIGAHLTGGDVTVRHARAADSVAVLDALERSGAKVERLQEVIKGISTESIRVSSNGHIKPVDITTQPFPGFATDVQAQWMALMTQAEGDSVITETIFENRFMHVSELTRMGAELTIMGNNVRVKGKPGSLQGAPVMATDLRASACLVLAALKAQGISQIKRIYHLDRGYENMESKLRGLGAKVERETDV